MISMLFNIGNFENKRSVELELELAKINYEIKKIDLKIADYERREANANLELVDSELTTDEFKEMLQTILDKNLSDEDYGKLFERIESLPQNEDGKVSIEVDEDFVAYMIFVIGSYGLLIKDLNKEKLKLLEKELEIHEEMLQTLEGDGS